MCKSYDQLKRLFSLSHDAVLGVADGVVVFANAAANSFWNKSIEGQPADGLLPDHLLASDADKLVCSAVIGQTPVSVSMTREEGVSLICVSAIPQGDKPLIDYTPINTSLNSSLHSLRTSADWLIHNAVDMTEGQAAATSAILMRSYFSALRTMKNVSTLQQIMAGTIPFDPIMTDLAEFIGELVDSVGALASKMGMSVEFKSPGGDFGTCVDQNLLEQLVLNLLSNSLLHMEKADSVTVSLRRENGRVIIAVDDTGSGIDDKTLSAIFTLRAGEAGLTDYTSGDGLGMHIVRGITEKHGGVIILESRQNEGTSIRVMLPQSVPQSLRFSDARTRYRGKSLDNILRELSGFLDADFFRERYLD